MADAASMEARFPNLIDYQDDGPLAQLNLALDDARLDVDITIWGPLYERGLEYLAAHNTARSDGYVSGDADAFPVSQATADGVSVTFAVPPEVRAELAPFLTTPYGIEYLELLRRRTTGPRLVAV